MGNISFFTKVIFWGRKKKGFWPIPRREKWEQIWYGGFLGQVSNKSMQRSSWKNSWEVYGLYLPSVNFYFIFNFTLSTRWMFCWTGVSIRYYFSLNTLHWKEFWDKPLIIPQTPLNTALTWFDWFWLLITSFSQQTPPSFTDGLENAPEPFPLTETELRK